MKFFNRTPDHHNEHNKKECSCGDRQGLFLNKRQANHALALLLLLSIFIFVAGYFWGQHTAVDQLLHSVERDSFADQIYYSMCSLYDQKDEESNEPDVVSGNEEISSEEQRGVGVEQSATTNIAAIQTPATYVPDTKHNKAQYYAQLAGFSSQQVAQQVVKRVASKGITVKVQPRQSKTARNNIVRWYQVVTKDFNNRASLEAEVGRIKRYEALHDVRIVKR